DEATYQFPPDPAAHVRRRSRRPLPPRRQVKEIEWPAAAPQRSAEDPCRLVRQVNEILQVRPGQSDSPAGRAGRGRILICFTSLAENLSVLPDEPAGADEPAKPSKRQRSAESLSLRTPKCGNDPAYFLALCASWQALQFMAFLSPSLSSSFTAFTSA